MHCYCKAMFIKDKSFKAMDIPFTNFTKDGKPDKTLYCQQWFYNYAFQNFMVVGTSLVVVVINIVASTILTLIVSIEKQHTVNDETMGQF